MLLGFVIRSKWLVRLHPENKLIHESTSYALYDCIRTCNHTDHMNIKLLHEWLHMVCKTATEPVITLITWILTSFMNWRHMACDNVSYHVITLSTPRNLNFSIPLVEFHQLKILIMWTCLSTKKIKFSHPSGSVSSSPRNLVFPTSVARLHLFKKLNLWACCCPQWIMHQHILFEK